MCEIGGNSAEALTTEALGATELGTWVSILAVFLTSRCIPFMDVSLNGAASPVTLFFCLSDFVSTDCEQIMESATL